MERIRGGWVNVPEHLKCKTDLKEMGLKPTGEAKAEVWNSHIWVKLYDINETAPRKPATEKQLAAIEKARAAQLAARTCSRCGEIIESLFQGMCNYCRESLFIKETSENALELFRSWVHDKSKYLILDTETTGLDYDSEIVDIAVIDLDENILLESLVKPVCPIPEVATIIHGITNKMVENAPSWPEIWPQIKQILSAGKIILIYNDSFDIGMIRSNCERHNLPFTAFESICVMQTYAEYVGNYSRYRRDFTWISLADAAYEEDIRLIGIGSHRAKSDCIACSRLIHRIVAERGVEVESVKNTS